MLSRSLGAAAVAAVVALLPGSAIATQNNVPTFTKDVAPIFQAKCEACHRVNSIAPMSLVTYEESRPWARSIRDRVSTRQMPPWHIDRTVGISDFRNDRSLTDADIDTIVRWVDGGAPRGNPEDMPAPVEWPDASKWYFAERFGGPPDCHRDRPDRAALGARHRASSRDDRRPPDDAPRHRAEPRRRLQLQLA